MMPSDDELEIIERVVQHRDLDQPVTVRTSVLKETKIWHGYNRAWCQGILCYEGFYQNGRQEGEEKYWYDNGVLSTHKHYKNGLGEGECVNWNQDGIETRRENFVNGKLHGTRTIFYPYLNKTVTQQWQDGTLISEDSNIEQVNLTE